MPRNQYFNHVANTSERDLLLSLTQETINMHGVEVWYISNNYANADLLYGEDRKPNLTNATKIVVYIAHPTDGYEGNPTFSKFGFFNPQNIDLTISRKEWIETMGSIRPTEGSIIYIPGWDTYGPTDFVKIDFVDKFDASGFFPLGVHPSFTLQCSKWQYSSESITTGNLTIDNQVPNFTNDIAVNPTGNPTDMKDNVVITTKGNAVIDFTESNPFGNL